MSSSNYYATAILAHYLIDLMIFLWFSYKLHKFNNSFVDRDYLVNSASSASISLARSISYEHCWPQRCF